MWLVKGRPVETQLLTLVSERPYKVKTPAGAGVFIEVMDPVSAGVCFVSSFSYHRRRCSP
jgi:hypothetical protein